MKYEKPFKAYNFFFILSLYKQFICKRQVTQCIRKFFLQKCGAYLGAALKTIVSAAAHIKSPNTALI